MSMEVPKKALVQGADQEEVNGVYNLTKMNNERGYYTRGEDGMHLKISYSKRISAWIIYKNHFILYYTHNHDMRPPSQGWFRKGDDASIPNLTVTMLASDEVPTPPVPSISPVADALFCDDFSDIQLVCQDGVSISTHKVILASSCPYFKSAFAGAWKENARPIQCCSFL